MLFARALLAFLALPTVVAGIVPWLLVRSFPWTGQGPWLGWPIFASGLTVLLECVRGFYRSGKGTLAPWDPPKNLVTTGLYRFQRNPMYVGVLAIIAGWAILAGSAVLAGYAALLAVAFHLRVVLYEEPKLAQLFPEAWPRYRTEVNRWMPRLPR